MTASTHTDIAIIGGGIAGLWLLNLLKKQGFSAILLENNALGSGQTGKSQGIIHGGMKYALQGILTPAAKAIADMPALWKECLAGKGEIDLSNVTVLSTKQYLWSTASLSSKLANFVAGITLNSHVQTLKKADFPAVFQHPSFAGQVNALDEMVVDVYSLLAALAKPHQDIIFKVNTIDTAFDNNNKLTLHADKQLIKAQKIIFTAGSGNEILMKSVPMQRRPLHMVMVKHDYNLPVYAHCLGLSNTPRITITTHKAHDGKTIWYLGGQISEEGVSLSTEEQINVAKEELQKLFSWLDFTNAKFATFFVDRAEHYQENGKRPDHPFIKNCGNWLVAWPTKLAFAPQLAHDIIKNLQDIKPAEYNLSALAGLPNASIATPMWDQLL